MRYTVVWHQIAQDELASIWLAAIERGAVTRAADQIDVILRHDPATKGTEFEGRRLLSVAPLVVLFNIDEANRIVRVQKVWRDSTAN